MELPEYEHPSKQFNAAEDISDDTQTDRPRIYIEKADLAWPEPLVVKGTVNE
jgi:hypothetical protein